MIEITIVCHHDVPLHPPRVGAGDWSGQASLQLKKKSLVLLTNTEKVLIKNLGVWNLRRRRLRFLLHSKQQASTALAPTLLYRHCG